MSRLGGESTTWDGGPPGAETEPPSSLSQPTAPHNLGLPQTARTSVQEPSASDGCSRDDFLYAKSDRLKPGSNSQVSVNLVDQRRNHHNSISTNRNNDERSRKHHYKSKSRSPERRYRKSRSRSKSKEKFSRRKKYCSSPKHRISHDRSPRKYRKMRSSSSDRSKSMSRSLSKEKLKMTKNDSSINKRSSKYSRSNSRSHSSGRSNSDSSNISDKHSSKFKEHSRDTSYQKKTWGVNTKLSRSISPFPQKALQRHIKNAVGSRSLPHSELQSQINIHNYPTQDLNQAPVAAPFRNDGSFLEMFKKLQEAQKAQEESASSSAPSSQAEIKKPSLPLVGKRRGGRVLKTGMVKKPKSIEEQTVDNTPTDAWSLYMKEVKKYKDSSCDEECKMRPLFK